jgi:hypothetical protein
MKTLLKNFILIFLLACAVQATGQGMFNNGALIVIQTNALVHIDGDASGKFTNSTNSTDGRIDIDGVMEVEGNWTNNAANDVFVNNDGNGWVKLNGAAASTQTIGGSHLTVFENLEVNHATQGVTCGNTNNQVNAQLKLTSGPLTLNSKIFIVNNTATTSIARNGTTETGYIVSETLDNSSNTGGSTPVNTALSRLQWTVNNVASGTYTIPFGTITGTDIPLVFQVTGAASGAGSITAATYHTSPSNYPYPGYPDAVNTMEGGIPLVADNSGNVADRFWSVVMSSNPTITFTFNYDVANDLNGQSPIDLQAQYWDPAIGGWATPIGIGNSPNYVNSVSGINASRVWTLANKKNPLPVELLAFNANCSNEKVIASWSTASEINNDYFSVEKSQDLNLWETVGLVPGAGTSNNVNSYNLTDNNPYPGFGYYRLKQTDFNGTSEYFQPIQVNCMEDGQSVFDISTIESNQNNNEIVITFSYPVTGDKYTFALFNDRGRLIQQQSKKTVKGFNQVIINYKDFAEGIYLITLTNSEKMISQKVILK